MSIEVHVSYAEFADELRLHIIEKDFNGVRRIARPMPFVFEPFNVGQQVEPSMILPFGFSEPFLQAMADCCEKAGIRPKGKPVLENELTAIKYHLEDMRTLVFKKETT